jgi:thiamine kinase-like enzyme
MLVSEAAPGITPRVIGASESDVGSILFLEPFIGDQIVTSGRDGLEKVARSLAQIQTRFKFEGDHSSSVKTTETCNVQAAFAFCKDQILSNFENVWESDRERKLSIAFCGTIAEIKPLLNSVERTLPKWIDQVQQSKLPLSIHHGDLHAGNAIVQPNGTALIFDWENGSVAHPFFSMEKLLTSAWELDVGATGGPWGYLRRTPSQDFLREVYLQEFGLEETEHRRAFDAAMCLATILEMEHEIQWAHICDWPDSNPEWTAQLLNRLKHHMDLAIFPKP